MALLGVAPLLINSLSMRRKQTQQADQHRLMQKIHTESTACHTNVLQALQS
jgi:hypothetical protein